MSTKRQQSRDQSLDLRRTYKPVPSRKHLERRSHSPHQQSFELVSAIDDGFFAVNEAWRFTYINSRAQRILAADRKRLLDKVIWEEFPQLVGSDLFLHMRRAAEQQRGIWLATQLPHGEWAEVHVYPCVGGLCVYFRLIGEAERTKAERSVVATKRRIVAALEQERQRIARELHDGAGQMLAALSVGLRTLEDSGTLEEAKKRAAVLCSIAARIFDELGQLIRGLHPKIVQELGLAAALRRFVTEFSHTVGVRSELDIHGLRSLKLDLGMQIELYRIVQEALANVGKHAGATMARVAFKYRPPTLQVTIRDNGRGFAVNRVNRKADMHLGLRTMRERAEMLGGKLWVQSAPGSGTVISAVIPVAQG